MSTLSAVPGLETTITDMIEADHAMSHLTKLMETADRVEAIHDMAVLHAEEGFSNEESSTNVKFLVKPMNNALYHLDRAIGRELRRLRSLTSGLEVGANQLADFFTAPDDLSGLTEDDTNGSTGNGETFTAR